VTRRRRRTWCLPPTHEDVDLVIDPASADFTGHVAIELDVLAPTKVLWLNADEIAVDEAAVTAGGRPLAATPVLTWPA
jgi:alanyl aminopeptidase